MAGSSEKRAKDSAMAGRLKTAGEERTVTRCPVCHRTVALDKLSGHLATLCKSGRE